MRQLDAKASSKPQPSAPTSGDGPRKDEVEHVVSAEVYWRMDRELARLRKAVEWYEAQAYIAKAEAALEDAVNIELQLVAQNGTESPIET